ncbi:hypothetical protein XELAEV_18034164mg [Xenopus laevis]|uniref:Ig-like domain-containing protein n=1 Tax=Xenopus laevis TaxID=8355 RepID=A0A974CE19_XENLA|nr:hypothetical protein XELAEV_18034164mg [Xenopus laevis]
MPGGVFMRPCRAVTSGNKVTFGEGTILHVLEKGQEEKNVANVAIFRPNPKEQTDHGYLSIVCLASGFFPEHVQLQWKVNKKERDGSQGKAIKTGDTYSISSRLSLTKNEYYNPDNTFECSAGLRGRTDVKTESIRGEKSCGVSPDELKRIVNNGVYSYILILCKTALYGLIVTAIVLRKKAIANAY